MRRFLVAVSLTLALVATAAPAAAAEAFQLRGEGNWASVWYSNLPNGEEPIPPGTYVYTEVFASSTIFTGEGEIYEDSGVCLFHAEITIDADGNWSENNFLGTCGYGELTIARRLSAGSIVASFPLEECLVWDEETKECLEMVSVGSIDVDLALTGTGPTYRYHGVSTGGTAGIHQYSSHGTGTSRTANAAGTLTLSVNGAVTDLTGGVPGFGSLQQSRDGYVQVNVH
jgi:hypothetical protein